MQIYRRPLQKIDQDMAIWKEILEESIKAVFTSRNRKLLFLLKLCGNAIHVANDEIHQFQLNYSKHEIFVKFAKLIE